MNRLTVALSCLSFAVVACNSASGTPTLTSLTSVASDMKCPSGGVTLTAGPDKNGNGKLDADEVNQTQEICNGTTGQPGMNGMNGTNGMNGMNGTSGDGGAGTNGTTSLVKTTALPAGDAHCTMGGTQLDFGLDNGAGGGTADDGVLQAGEILSTSYVCNGSLPYYPDDITPPTAPAGQFSIRSSGGDGVNGPGGSAAGVSISLEPGSLGGGVKVFNTGKVDASFTLPAQPAFVAGTAPLDVTANLTINPYADLNTGLASNDVYFRVDNDSLLYQNVSGAAVEVTSLSVAAGKTLSLPVDAQSSFIQLFVRHDIHNAGTIQIGAMTSDLTSGASIQLHASNFYQDATGSLITKGLAGASGSNGGSGGGINISIGALFINQGTIDSSGGDGDNGGQGGALTVFCDGLIYNTGALATFGGIGNNSNGGLGGQVVVSAALGVFNSHRIDAYGGSGVSAGGNCQGVNLSTGGLGALKNSGAINAYGGSCTVVDCNGGNGCGANLTASGGDLFNDATLDTHGGDSVSGGGSAGNIDIETNGGYSFSENVTLAAGSIHCDGNLVAVGGKGAPAGNGGYITVRVNPNNEPMGQKLELFGYTLIEANGGTGDNAPGGSSNNSIAIFTATSFPSFGESNSGAASGPVVNYAKLTARGGDGTQGGQGGYVTLETQLDYDFKQPLETALNFGDIDVGAGASSNFSQSYAAGSIQIEGVSGMENHGALKAVGGNTSGGPASAGQGGNIALFCDSGLAKNTGAGDVSGGGGSGNGGPAGEIALYGTTLNNSGALSANGGNGTAAGGEGGYVTLQSGSPPSTNTGTLSAAGGTGTPAGTKGYVLVDGIDVTP